MSEHKDTSENVISEEETELISENNLDQMMQELKTESEDTAREDQQPPVDKAEEKKPEEALSEETVKKYKLFFVTDMDEEADYLHKMSLQGLHFKQKKGMQYLFVKGQPGNYFYHLGYYEKDKHDPQRYVENYREAGWEDIYQEKGEFDGVWHCFRTLCVDGEEVHIFSDRESRIALYKRLRTSWRSLLAMIFICFVFVLGFLGFLFFGVNASAITTMVIRIVSVLLVCMAAIFVLYLYLYRKLGVKLEELLKH